MSEASLKEALSPFHYQHSIFHDNEYAIKLMLNHGILRNIRCKQCQKSTNVQNRSRFLNGKCYRCNSCKTCYNISSGNKFLNKFNIKFNDFFRLAYIWIFNLPNYIVPTLAQISEVTYIRFKNSMMDLIGSINDPIVKIGGPNKIIQLDEIIISKAQILTDASNITDDSAIQWLIGGIDNDNSSRFFLHLIPNRTSEAILNVLETYVLPETIIITNGCPFYSDIIERFGSQHVVVSNAAEFARIESIWNHFKQACVARHGLEQSRINLFVKEFEWRKKTLKYNNRESISNAFVILLETLKNFAEDD